MLVLFLVSSPLWAGVELGVAPGIDKILPATELPAATTARVAAARGEWEGFQVVVRSDGDIATLNATLSDLQGPATIPAADCHLYREWYLDIERASPMGVEEHEREPGLYPDPLIPLQDPWTEGREVGSQLPLIAGDTGTLYIDLWVPHDAPYGSYDGTLTVDADGTTTDVPVELEVWDISIPAERSIGTSFGVSDNHFGYYHDEGREDFDDIWDRYFFALREHRIDRTHVDGDLEFSFDEHGELEPVDWSAYDAEVGPWIDGSYFPDGTETNRFDVDRFAPGSGTGDMSEDEFLQAAAAFAEHLDQMGWWDNAYVYATDEPWLNGGDETYQRIRDDVQRLEVASPLWEGKTLITGPFDERLDGDVGIWCPVTPMYHTWFWGEGYCGTISQSCADRSVYPERIALGEELWFYVCNANFPPYAGYDIDTAIGYEPRIVKWGSWYEGASGFLFWRSNYWVNNDPWNHWANWDYFGAMFSRNGDGFIMYPGDHDGSAGTGSPDGISLDGPVVSYRMKQIRDGLEDWEMLLLLQDLGGDDYARAQTERIYQRFGDGLLEDCDDDAKDNAYCPDDQPWTLDGGLLLEVRANIAAKIMFLQDPDTWPDPEAQPGDTGLEDGEGCGCAAGGLAGGGLLWLLAMAPVLRRRQ
jgi:hypothetical protein